MRVDISYTIILHRESIVSEELVVYIDYYEFILIRFIILCIVVAGARLSLGQEHRSTANGRDCGGGSVAPDAVRADDDQAGCRAGPSRHRSYPVRAGSLHNQTGRVSIRSIGAFLPSVSMMHRL